MSSTTIHTLGRSRGAHDGISLFVEQMTGARNTVAAVPYSVRAVPAVCTPRSWLGSAATPQRYAHLHNDPLRRASKAIAGRIAAALGGNAKAVALRHLTAIGGKANSWLLISSKRCRAFLFLEGKVYVIGENTIDGIYIQNARIIAALVQKAGLPVVRRRSRRLPPNRRYYRLQIVELAKRLWTVECEVRLSCILRRRFI